MTRAVSFVSRHFKAFACLAYLIAAMERVIEAILHQGPIHEIRSNNLTQFFVNYVEHGFARRAFVGSVLHPVLANVPQPELLVFWIMVALNIAGFAAILVLVDRYLPHDPDCGLPTLLRCALAVGSVGVMQIAHDLGRFDLVNYFVLLAVIWLALRGAFVAAALGVGLGILIHEAFAVFAAPLAFAVAWFGARRTMPFRASAQAVAPMPVIGSVAALAVLLQGNSDAAAALTVGTGADVWQRGLIEIGSHLAPFEVAVLAAYWLVLCAILVWTYRRNDHRPDLFFLAAACPLILNLLGVDHGRWLTIAFLMLVLNLAVQVRYLGLVWPTLRPWQRNLAFLLCLPLGPHGVTGAWAWLL